MALKFFTSARAEGRSAPPSTLSGPRHAALRIGSLLAAVLLAGGLLPFAAGPAGAVATAARASGAAAIVPIDFSIAVDESGSIQKQDMLDERDAASRIALGNVSDGSQVDIFGFASADNPPQHPVDTLCAPLTLDAIGRSKVGACAAQLKKRQPGTGTGTDFPAAIRQGIASLKDAPAGTPRVLFMLTDGKLDVSSSSSYGDPAHRAAEGVRQLGLALDEAKAAQVEVWPLGFGSDVDDATMRQMAAGGYQQTCPGLADTAPKAQDVHSSAEVGAALQQAFASAGCLHNEPGPGPQYPPTTQHVHISVVATVGAIVVSKGDPAVTVTYTDPNGQQLKPDSPLSGSFDGSSYDLAGRGDLVESLRLTDPVPGDWKVFIDAPVGHRGQLATVSVLWHGELRTSITLDPPNPRPGSTAVVTLQLLTRKDTPITDPRDLQGMQVAAALKGAGFPDQPLALADNGAAPDVRAGDGAFTGTAAIPATANGEIQATATLSAAGLTADPDRSVPGQVALGPAAVSSLLTLSGTAVHPGGAVHGTLRLRNSSSATHTLQLSLGDTADGLLTVDPPTVSLAAGESRDVPVTLRVASADAFRAARVSTTTRLSGAVTVADTSAGGQPLVQQQVTVSVTPTPTFWDKYGAGIVLAIVVLLALFAAVVLGLRIRVWNRRARGLRLELALADGTPLGTLAAGRAGKGNWFEFRIVDPLGDHPTLVAGAGAYAVRRDPRAGALLRITGEGEQPLPRGRKVTLDVGQDRELLLSLTEGSRPPRPGGLLNRLLGRRTPVQSRPGPAPRVTVPGGDVDDEFDPDL